MVRRRSSKKAVPTSRIAGTRTSGGAPKTKIAIPTRIDVTVPRRADARVARGMKTLRYEFVTTDALSSGGAVKVWKTTQ